ncbi:hypothetical protein K491DRAFT_312660 [Lophiostoma macrostomum CBS 122681]|uniref:Uncharacterized protein n=1 Tax=Lophiostoma macrostomum CBS 122681 TaxID=1314788 RepID=A0A6A6TFT2_9PLEO|nr:hypothetical protein K491DRAFT_312660 [Lophiostoma macrostomum CBS 122681]
MILLPALSHVASGPLGIARLLRSHLPCRQQPSSTLGQRVPTLVYAPSTVSHAVCHFRSIPCIVKTREVRRITQSEEARRSEQYASY